MPTIFSRIIAGELPARFVWKDNEVVAFLSSGKSGARRRPAWSGDWPRTNCRYWVSRKMNPNRLKNASVIAPDAAEKRASPKKPTSRHSSGCAFSAPPVMRQWKIREYSGIEWNPRRIGLMIVGEEVPHTHLHVVPINEPGELSFAHVDAAPDPAALDDAAARLRAQLRAMGCESVSA